MIHPGLCSLTLAALSPAEILQLCAEVGLTHIEWWGKDHVPMGDVEAGTEVGRLTRQAGLCVSSYGSYYRVGESERQGLTFDSILKTTEALEAPAVRVWAGGKGSQRCSPQQRERVIAETLRLADLCQAAGLRLIFEYHGGTLTDTNASAAAFAGAVQHPAVYFGWQMRAGADIEEKTEGLRAMLPRLATLHVFNWSKNQSGKHVRHPLVEAVAEWRDYFAMVAETGRDVVALLEFVKDNSIEQFREDARVLKELLWRQGVSDGSLPSTNTRRP